jgi:hypothetical protein
MPLGAIERHISYYYHTPKAKRRRKKRVASSSERPISVRFL